MEEQTNHGQRGRGEVARMAAVLVALLLVTGVVLLVAQGEGGSDLPDRGSVEGRLLFVSEEKLVLQPADGSGEITFELRPIHARQLDLFHLQTHASDGLATIVEYERDGDTLYALSADDA
jgi:hypothetical protein